LVSSAFLKAGIAACTALIVFGCSSTGPGFPSAGVRYDPNKPQAFLAGATVEQAKGVAMGAAVSKGWSVVQSSGETLVLQRDLNAAVAESISPGASVAPVPPVIEVQSTFFQRDMGVDVVLDAQVVTGRGTDQERKVDYTENYRNELTQSLNSLRQAWNSTGSRVASATPPLPTSGTAQSAPGQTGSAPDVDDARDVPPAAVAVAQAPVEDTATAWGPAPARAAAPEPTADPGAPVEDRSLAADPAPVAAVAQPPARVEAASPERSANMLVLNPRTDTGIWAYYAEHYARVRGCALTDGGSVLIEKQAYSETHRVDCEGGRSFLVRCNAGVCRGLR
jgi:hypothetical protein